MFLLKKSRVYVIGKDRHRSREHERFPSSFLSSSSSFFPFDLPRFFLHDARTACNFINPARIKVNPRTRAFDIQPRVYSYRLHVRWKSRFIYVYTYIYIYTRLTFRSVPLAQPLVRTLLLNHSSSSSRGGLHEGGEEKVVVDAGISRVESTRFRAQREGGRESIAI